MNKNVIFSEIKQGANAVAKTLQMNKMIPVDESLIGDFPWYWKSGTNFNANTFQWLNNVFAYKDGYIITNGNSFTTAYYNVLSDTSYYLSASDSEKLNNANRDVMTVSNTLITDWVTTQGTIPAEKNTQTKQLNFIMEEIIKWGEPDLTLATLRKSIDPMSLLPNIPLGADNIVSDLMTYLADTSSVANIQAAVISANNQLSQTKKNISPAPAAICEGWMQTIDDKGNLILEPEIIINEDTSDINNNLTPSGGGKSFTASFTAANGNSDTVSITAASGGTVSLSTAFFLTFSGSAGANLNIFSADTSQQSVQVELTFNGVTTVTPKAYSYNITSQKGWWNSEPIRSAANPVEGHSGYQFNPAQSYNFRENGDFGFISRLMISQQPIIKLTYKTSNYAAYQKVFQEKSSIGISFMGIPLGGGSQSYYQTTSSYNQNTQTVTITMSPAGVKNPVSITKQLAYVVGAEVVWMGAK